MSANCCHCCERRELKKQCRIDIWTGAGEKRVLLIHIPTGTTIIGTSEDDVLDSLDKFLQRKMANSVN